MTQVTHIECNAEEQRAALARMFEIEKALPKATPEEAKALQEEHDALDGSWLHEVVLDLPLMTASEAQAFTVAEQAKEANARTIEEQAIAALAANATYLASNPNSTQVAAQVKALTRQSNKLIRLLLRRLDSTD